MPSIIFVPGRTELAGNHTDHQNGRVLASAIDLGITASYTAIHEPVIRIQSAGFKAFEVKLSQVAVRPVDFGKPVALVRGVVSAFQDLGLSVGGFEAIITNNIPIGAGLSSSAAFSVLIGKILNNLYNDDAIGAWVLAGIAQRAENNHFGKPSGMVSQLICALGGTVYVDLKTRELQTLHPDFSSMGLTLTLTDTGGSHAGLDTSYARIPADMKYVANLFDCGVLADVDPEKFWSKGWDSSNRPIRRAMHFFRENERVPAFRDALLAGDRDACIRLMNESGRSSEVLLNNIVTSSTGDTKLALGLEKSKELLDGIGAWRVHGGGFAGCVQGLMPMDYFPVYKNEIEKVFGKDSCREVHLL